MLPSIVTSLIEYPGIPVPKRPCEAEKKAANLAACRVWQEFALSCMFAIRHAVQSMVGHAKQKGGQAVRTSGLSAFVGTSCLFLLAGV